MSTGIQADTQASTPAIERTGFVGVLQRSWVILLAFLLPTLLAATLLAWSVPRRYVASTTILSQVPFNPASNLSSQLGVQSPVDNPLARSRLGTFVLNDRFKIILASRSLREQVVRSLHLTQRDDWIMPRMLSLPSLAAPGDVDPDELMDRTLSKLASQVAVEDTREGALVVSATAPNPLAAAELANAYIDKLNLFLNSSVLSAVKRGRLFIEGQLKKSKANLSLAEEALRLFQSERRTVALPEQTRATVEASGKIREQIAQAEVELSMKTLYLTDQDKDVAQLQQRLAALRRQQTQLEVGPADGPAEFQLPLSAVPNVGKELVRLQRNLATQEKIYALLTEQYELAKIVESREDISFQIVDRAVPPQHAKGVSGVEMVLSAGVLALLLAFVYLGLVGRLRGLWV